MNSAQLFKSMRIFILPDINTVQVACFAYGVIHNTLSEIFHIHLVKNRFIQVHLPRHNEDKLICDATSMLEHFVYKYMVQNFGIQFH